MNTPLRSEISLVYTTAREIVPPGDNVTQGSSLGECQVCETFSPHFVTAHKHAALTGVRIQTL